jgi:NAD-dependent SIR2 family protein deacetylase
MNYTVESFQPEARKLRQLINQADAVLIGAGAGLSAASGHLYMDFAAFKNWFPGYHERYGLRFIYEADFFEFPTREEYFAYWARHILKARFQSPAGKTYRDLFKLVGNLNYFVLTTNVDGQFAKAGFDSQRICTPQGDFAYFQCSKPCSNELYYNEPIIQAMLAGIDNDSFTIRSHDIPLCPRCGRMLEPNIRKDANFVEEPWMEKYVDLEDFLAKSKSGKLVILELGAGFNTPSIIRFPFEKTAATYSKSFLIRVNKDNPELSIFDSFERFAGYPLDIGDFLTSLLNVET